MSNRAVPLDQRRLTNSADQYLANRIVQNRRNVNCSGKNGMFALDVASYRMVVGIRKVITTQVLVSPPN